MENTITILIATFAAAVLIGLRILKSADRAAEVRRLEHEEKLRNTAAYHLNRNTRWSEW